ncbi:MAG: hypothetical protein MJ048_00565 [Acidaminococcaceae bacterium]|nr:hypothetical protein [Acidaminococcaceae bacterium]
MGFLDSFNIMMESVKQMSNEYEAKIALQKQIINDLDGDDKIRELKRIAKQSNIENPKKKLCSREQILDKKSSRVSKISSLPMTEGEKAKIGKWNTIRGACSQECTGERQRFEENFKNVKYKVAEKNETIDSKFNNLKKLVERGGASD